MLGLAALAVAGMFAVIQWMPPLLGEPGGLSHAAGRPASVAAWIVAGSVVLALSATWLVLPSRRSMLFAGPGLLVAVPLLVGVWLVLWHATYLDPFTRAGWRCFTLTTLTAPWPFAVLAHASRFIEPRHPAVAGAALGSVAGAWAAVMVELWCPLTVHPHVLVGHVAPIVALSLAGAAFGVRMFRLRRS